MKKIYIICVLYNKYISEIRSIDNFIRLKESHNEVDIILLDNSIYLYKEKNAQIYNDKYMSIFSYIQNNKNIGLSKAYNKALENIKDDNYWFMLSDDDTYFSMDYLENIVKEMKSNEYKLIAGIVNNEKGIMSPTTRYPLSNVEKYVISEIGVYDNIYCINSGLCINSEIIKCVGKYDENLFLDLVDYNFMDRLIKLGKNQIKIVDGEIKQSFSGTQEFDHIAVKNRYNIFKKDFIYYCKINKKSFIFKKYILFKRYLNIRRMGVMALIKNND